MKRISGLVCIALCVMVAFGGPAPAGADEKKVGLLWVGRSHAADDFLLGFSSRLREIAPEIKIELRRNLKDMAEGEKIFREFESTQDGIVFLRSNGAQFLATADPKVPTFIGACNNPTELGAIKNLDAPEGKITGVSHFVPFETRFKSLTSLFPNAKRVALLLEKGHPGSVIDDEGTSSEAAKRGIEYHSVMASNLNEMIEEMKKLKGKVDLFIISTTRLAFDNATTIVGQAMTDKTPVFSYWSGCAQKGAVAEIYVDQVRQGQMLAESVVDVLVKGKPVSKVPVKLESNPAVVISEISMRALGIKFPDSVLKNAQIVQ
jgi:putative tryptophan/tyrosine transport system substrate-binding protein